MNIDAIEESVFEAVREADRRRNAALARSIGDDRPVRFGYMPDEIRDGWQDATPLDHVVINTGEQT